MKLHEVMRIRVHVETPIGTGAVPAGESRVIPFAGGSFEGDGLAGQITSGGSDWQRIWTNGVLEIDARYMLQTDEGERIAVRSTGIRAASAEVLARLAVGEDVPGDEYYFRTFIRLTTGAERLAWMNERLFIGVGERRARDVQITVYQVP